MAAHTNTSAFERLDEVRSAARARAQEDFEFFCRGVLGFEVSTSDALAIQPELLKGRRFDLQRLENKRYALQLERAMIAWQVVVGLSGEIVHGPSETFEWLFPEVARRAA